jgi:hypothetical protein
MKALGKLMNFSKIMSYSEINPNLLEAPQTILAAVLLIAIPLLSKSPHLEVHLKWQEALHESLLESVHKLAFLNKDSQHITSLNRQLRLPLSTSIKLRQAHL